MKRAQGDDETFRGASKWRYYYYFTIIIIIVIISGQSGAIAPVVVAVNKSLRIDLPAEEAACCSAGLWQIVLASGRSKGAMLLVLTCKKGA